MRHVHNPAVAGLFYPAEPTVLGALVDSLLDQPATLDRPPRALIAPHAGYMYSGAVAGRAYAELRRHAASVRHVMLLGPSHRVALYGMALPDADVIRTPLGDLSVDAALRDRAMREHGVQVMEAAHASEHCLEVHLPFLQRVLTDFDVLPVVVGETSPGPVAALVRCALARPATLVLVSTDLSHFHDETTARRLDAATSAAIQARSSHLQPQQACGCRPLNGLLRAAAELDLEVCELARCTSADTAGTADRVVGYAAYALI